jgi:hypothetical protein
MRKVTAYVECRVWDFDLPATSHLKTHSWDQIEYLADFYNLDEYPVEWYMNFLPAPAKNRFNPGSAGVNYVSEKPVKKGRYDFSRVEKVLPVLYRAGTDQILNDPDAKGIIHTQRRSRGL